MYFSECSACIIFIVGIRAIYKGSTATDFTHNNRDMALWTCIEVNSAIFGDCVPVLLQAILHWEMQNISQSSREVTL